MNKLLAVTMILLAGQVQGQDNSWNETIQQLSFVNETERSREYFLGPGDLLEVKVFGLDEYNQTVRVSASGKITLPYLGSLIASGLSGMQLEELLAEELRDRKLIKDPQVSVFVTEYRSQPIYVLGAVNQPGQYMMTHQLSLLDALTMAGGLVMDRASDHALLQRGAGAKGDLNLPDEEAEVIRIDLKPLLEGGDLSLNIQLAGGDVLHVPERKIEVYYVVGEVGRAGAFELPVEQRVLVSQALAQAGGPGKTAKMSDGILVRYEGNGNRQELAVDFEAILKGKKPDFPVGANDIIFVPGSTAKTIGYGLLGIIPGTVQGAIIWGRY